MALRARQILCERTALTIVKMEMALGTEISCFNQSNPSCSPLLPQIGSVI